MRTKLLYLKSLLIICLLCIAGGTQAWAQKTLASFNGKISGNEWTTNAEWSSKYYKLFPQNMYIQSPEIDLSKTLELTINLTARTYGGSGKENEISVIFPL